MMSRPVSRRRLVAGAAALVAAPAVLRAAEHKDASVVTQTALGLLRGRREDGLDVYKGIGYGGDVAGLRRFLPAQPALAWRGVRDALVFGPPAIQPLAGLRNADGPAPDENCLNLNVWTPAEPGPRRPVVFLLGGEGFSGGSAADPALGAAELARTHNLVVVTANHRLGLLGHLYLGALGGGTYDRSGNQGLWDLRLALRWVRDNITAFGGDPDRVTLFGENGGGARTACVYAMPSAALLFARGAIRGGPLTRIGGQDAAAEATRRVLHTLGLAATDWRKLIDAPTEDLLRAQAALAAPAPPGAGPSFGPEGFGPILDAELLPRHPFDPSAPPSARARPLMAGWSLQTDRPGIQTMLERKAAQNAAPAFAFSLPEDAAEARLRAYLAGFAQTGRPTAEGQPDWRPYTLPERATMIIGPEGGRLETAVTPPPPAPPHKKRFGIL